MAQVKIYGLGSSLRPLRAQLSDTIHSCLMDALALPADKRFHRFILLEREDFIYPSGRTERYTILEVSLFEGRTVESKKRLLRLLFERLEAQAGIAPADLEITISETPRHNWGIRGLPGDELGLTYTINV